MSYSAWHRRGSTRRFIGIERAQLLAMIDTDVSAWVEYDDCSKEPVGLVETAIDIGQNYKNATVTRNLAMRAGLPCFVVLYKLGSNPNPADPQYRDICQFRVKRLWPNPERDWRIVPPQEWAETLLRMRDWKASQLDEEFERTAAAEPF